MPKTNDKGQMINETDERGFLLCPVCSRGTVWLEQKPGDKRPCYYTSPMIKVVSSKVNALVHRCCVAKLPQPELKIKELA